MCVEADGDEDLFGVLIELSTHTIITGTTTTTPLPPSWVMARDSFGAVCLCLLGLPNVIERERERERAQAVRERKRGRDDHCSQHRRGATTAAPQTDKQAQPDRRGREVDTQCIQAHTRESRAKNQLQVRRSFLFFGSTRPEVNTRRKGWQRKPAKSFFFLLSRNCERKWLC